MFDTLTLRGHLATPSQSSTVFLKILPIHQISLIVTKNLISSHEMNKNISILMGCLVFPPDYMVNRSITIEVADTQKQNKTKIGW